MAKPKLNTSILWPYCPLQISQAHRKPKHTKALEKKIHPRHIQNLKTFATTLLLSILTIANSGRHSVIRLITENIGGWQSFNCLKDFLQKYELIAIVPVISFMISRQIRSSPCISRLIDLYDGIAKLEQVCGRPNQ